jgi:hypothetical protein
MDGCELAERARDLVPGLRVVLMVTRDHPASRATLQLGMTAGEDPGTGRPGTPVPKLAEHNAAKGDMV